jgi:hypothetical protein
MMVWYYPVLKFSRILKCKARCGAVGRATVQAGRALVQFPMSLEFVTDNPSGRTVALGSIQPLTEMSMRNISWGVKRAGALR